MAQALLYAGWISTRLGWRRHRTLERAQRRWLPAAAGGHATRWSTSSSRRTTTDDVRPGELLSVRLRSLGETGAAEFIVDREGDDAVVATNADGMTALLRLVPMQSPRRAGAPQLAADARRRGSGLRGRAAGRRDPARLRARGRRVDALHGAPRSGRRSREATADRFVAAARRRRSRSAASSASRSPAAARRKRGLSRSCSSPARRDAVDWSAVEFFWGDERAVPPDHPESNFGVAYGMLISQLPNVRPDRIHRMPAEAPDLDAAALSYESELRLAFGARGDEPPAFDLIWLGHGPRRPYRQPLSRIGRARRAAALGGRQLGAVAGRVAHDAHLPGPQRGTRRRSSSSPAPTRPMRCREIRAGGSDLPAARVDGDQVEWIVDRRRRRGRLTMPPLAWLVDRARGRRRRLPRRAGRPGESYRSPRLARSQRRALPGVAGPRGRAAPRRAFARE